MRAQDQGTRAQDESTRAQYQRTRGGGPGPLDHGLGPRDQVTTTKTGVTGRGVTSIFSISSIFSIGALLGLKLESREKSTKIMKSGMNQGQVCPFEPKLCQNVATASMTPLESLQTPKTIDKPKNVRKIQMVPLPPCSPC